MLTDICSSQYSAKKLYITYALLQQLMIGQNVETDWLWDTQPQIINLQDNFYAWDSENIMEKNVEKSKNQSTRSQLHNVFYL